VPQKTYTTGSGRSLRCTTSGSTAAPPPAPRALPAAALLSSARVKSWDHPERGAKPVTSTTPTSSEATAPSAKPSCSPANTSLLPADVAPDDDGTSGRSGAGAGACTTTPAVCWPAIGTGAPAASAATAGAARGDSRAATSCRAVRSLSSSRSSQASRASRVKLQDTASWVHEWDQGTRCRVYEWDQGTRCCWVYEWDQGTRCCWVYEWDQGTRCCWVYEWGKQRSSIVPAPPQPPAGLRGVAAGSTSAAHGCLLLFQAASAAVGPAGFAQEVGRQANRHVGLIWVVWVSCQAHSIQIGRDTKASRSMRGQGLGQAGAAAVAAAIEIRATPDHTHVHRSKEDAPGLRRGAASAKDAASKRCAACQPRQQAGNRQTPHLHRQLCQCCHLCKRLLMFPGHGVCVTLPCYNWCYSNDMSGQHKSSLAATDSIS
jgi:hypothetical protein